MRFLVQLTSLIALAACVGPAGADGSVALSRSSDMHFAIPVEVNGAGPYDFIIDTAASVTAVSPQLAQTLHLSAAAGMGPAMHGASGNQSLPIYQLTEIKSAVFDQTNVVAAGLPATSFGARHDGIIGIGAWRGKRLELDFAANRLSLGPSGAHDGFTNVPANPWGPGFLLVDIEIDGVRGKALVDTGASRTMLNMAYQKALGYAAGDPRLSPDEPIGGATSDRTAAFKTVGGTLTVGGRVSFEKPRITFADAEIFRTLGIDDDPAVILGADIWKRTKAIALDYPADELQIKQ